MAKVFNFHELKSADRLPSPSGTALAIIKLVQRNDATVQQVAQLLQTDPALSGRVLAFANSAAFGSRRPVVCIQDAVILIGMNAVRNFALSLSLIGKHNDGPCIGFDYAGYWSKSLMMAVSLAGIIARDRTTAPEEAFTLGLLAEIGRLALATVWPEKFSDCLKKSEGQLLLLLEQELFAMLTAIENEDSLVEAFDAGIDDYVTKPVSSRVLLARIRAGQRIIGLQQELFDDRKELERSTSELAVSNRRLQHLAHTDLLTALPNRRYALSRLEQERIASQRFNRPLSVLMLDLDYFKTINDTLGHDVGDQVLSHVAQVIRESIRANDVACRLGGEEFIVIAPNTDIPAALLLAERICKAIQARQLKSVALPRTVTVSIGVSSSTNCKTDWRDLVKMADQAVYKVKEKGRNGVQLASS